MKCCYIFFPTPHPLRSPHSNNATCFILINIYEQLSRMNFVNILLLLIYKNFTICYIKILVAVPGSRLVLKQIKCSEWRYFYSITGTVAKRQH